MRQISKVEFIALTAMMFATIAFSIDAMLPALPEIGAELSPGDVNRAQLILTSFVAGMGLGTLLAGPVSDALGRKRTVLGGAALYIAACLVAWKSETLEVVLAARFIQGIGAGAPRTVGVAIVRDLYSGREMARMLSFAMMVFTLFPAFAPLMGAGIIAVIGWRGIFLAFIAFIAICVLWMSLRLPETLPPQDRRPFRAALLWAALMELLRHPTVRLSMAVQTLCMAVLFSMLVMVQPAYDIIYGHGEDFPLWFAGVALLSGTASILNAAIVVRLGMRRIVSVTLGVQAALAAAMLALNALPLPDAVGFGLFVIWQASVFFMAGTTLGNLNAIAMEPMGHIAGTAASVMGAVSTVGAAILASPLGQMFNGSLTPLAVGIFGFCLLGLVLMGRMARQEAKRTV